MAELLSGSTVGGFLIASQNNDNAFCDTTATQLKIIKLGNQTALIDNNGNFTTSSGLINSEVANSSSQIGFTLNTPNYTTQGQKLFSIKNNDNEKFSIDKDGNITSQGNASFSKGLFLNRYQQQNGISFYKNNYTQWQIYMAPSIQGQGYSQNITQPTGSIVTSWALRSFIDSNSGYGWTWEKGASTATSPEIVAELGVNGNFRTVGEITATKFIGSGVSLTNVPWQSLTGKPTTLSGYGITDGVNTVDVVTTATANKILKLDSNQKLPQNITGNQETTTKLQTQRQIQLTGQVTGSQNFDGSQNVSIATTLASHTHTSQQISDQTNANTASTIVARDQSGNFSAGTITQQLSGNQSTATKLQTQRSIQLTGQVTGSQNFDGSQNISLATTLSSHTHTSQQISDQTNANTAGMIVKRDQSGNFNAGIITQSLNGKISRHQNSVKIYNNVFSFSAPQDPANGTLKITFPKGFSNTMFKLKIDGFEYQGSSLGNSWSVCAGGYNYSGGSWENYFAQIYGNAKFDKIRFGFDTATSKCVMLIGITTSTWYYPKINISEVMCGHSNYTDWDDDWNIDFITDESSINSIYTPSLSYITDQSGNFVQKTKIIQPEFLISNGLTSLTKGQNNSLRVATNYGYTDIGQQNNDYSHFFTDKPKFYFNKHLEVNGNISATKVEHAVYNDYQEYRNSMSRIEAGYVCIESESGNIELCKKDRQKNIQGIQSDTYGTIMGDSNQNNTPVSVQGRVLVYADNKRKLKIGDQVCATKNGKIRKMKWYEKILFPEQIVGIVSEFPTYETWGTDNIAVNNRIWLNIRR